MVNDFDNCVECKACEQICPKACIRFVDGRLVLDEEKCISCNLCEKVCQVMTPVEFYKQNKVYAAIAKSNEIYNESSSGGIANILYHTILNDGGVVFGVKYNDEFEPVFCCIEDETKLQNILRSKYCFSNIGHIFKKCRDFCNNGRQVLFIGLPCQIAGLKSFLGKKFDNLITVDILCHGAPHYNIFKNHIKYKQNKNNNKIIDYQFRKKENNQYGPYQYYISYANGRKEIGSALWDAYYKSFLKSEIFRKSCYSCQFAKKERVADITIGDFWTLRNTKVEFEGKEYISSIIVSTEKGNNFLKRCSKSLVLVESTFDDLKKSTHAVVAPETNLSKLDIEKLFNYSYYAKWAKKYENSLIVKIRKLKNILK